MEASSTSKAEPVVTNEYLQELHNHIRVTDDISFKLLALVPLVSVASIAASLLTEKLEFTPVVALLSLFAAAVTRALWIWERRNIQTCEWLRIRVALVEAREFHFADTRTPGHFYAFPLAPNKQGKTEAEKLVYSLTIGAWLLLPAAIFVSHQPQNASLNTWLAVVAYASAAGWVGTESRRTLRVGIDLTPRFPPKNPTMRAEIDLPEG